MTKDEVGKMLEFLFDREVYISDISEFLKVEKLFVEHLLPLSGFSAECLAHRRVAEQWNNLNPKTEEEIFTFYKTTDAYIYELSLYHLTSPCYENLCKSILSIAKEFNCNKVVDLGGGIGTLSMFLSLKGLDVTYYDVKGLTSDFAEFRFKKHCPNVRILYSDFTGDSLIGVYDLILGMDFFEHLTDVISYVKKCYEILTPEGVFVTQNAFNIGSPSSGSSIPCHLDINNHFEKDWDGEMKKIGFTQVRPQVYRRQ